jgi:hypothetical protein
MGVMKSRRTSLERHVTLMNEKRTELKTETCEGRGKDNVKVSLKGTSC